MKRTAAILGSCLKLLALVDAIALSKVSVSKYNVGWEKVESDWLPDQNLPSFSNYLDVLPLQSAENKDQYRTLGTPSNDLAYDGLMGRRPNAELAYNTQSQSLMSPNHVSDPYIKLRLKLKIKLPQYAARLGESKVSEPEYQTVMDKETQLSEEYPENTPVSSALDPSVGAYDWVDHVAKHLPAPVKDARKFEKLYHLGRNPTPHDAQEIAKADDLHPAKPVDDFFPQTTQIEALLEEVDKFVLLRDLVSKLTENSSLTAHEQPSSEAVSQASVHLVDDLNTTPMTSTDTSVRAYDGIEHSTENLSDPVEKIGKSKKLHHSRSPIPSEDQEVVKRPDVHHAAPDEGDSLPENTDIDAWLNYVYKLQRLKDLMDNIAETTALPDQNESSTVPTETKRHQSSGLLPGNQTKLPKRDNVESKDDGKFDKLYHSQRPIPYTKMVHHAGPVEDDSLPETNQNYAYFNDYVNKRQQPLLDEISVKPVHTDHESPTEPSEMEIRSWSERQKPTDLLNIPSANPARSGWFEESPSETEIQTSKHLPGGQMKLSDNNNVERKGVGQFQELYHSQEPILYTSHEMAKPDDSIVLHFAGPVEESLHETTSIDAYSSKPKLPVDIFDKTSEKATQTVHDESSTETKSQSSEHHPGEPLNKFQQPSDDFWFKQYESLPSYKERKTPPPILDMKDHDMSASVSETSGLEVWNNDRRATKNGDGKPTTSRSIFAKFWDHYGW